jgi:glycosyltransferase involved in cell wall biosynthesis
VRLSLVVPRDVDRPTGGNVYDLRLAGELTGLGLAVEVVRTTDAELPAAAQAAASLGGLVLIDGLLASHRPDVVRASRAGVLLHMPLAWRDPQCAGVEAEALRAAAIVVVTSQWTARFVREEYAVTAVVARPGVDPAPVETGSDPPLIVQVATLAAHKDQLAVVHALGQVRELAWRARLVGSATAEPAYAARVAALVIGLGLADRIELTGELPREAAFAGADLVLLPSQVEAFGMVVLEGLARGVPALVSAGGPQESLGRTATGQVPGVVLGETTLADAVRRWLTDPQQRADLRRFARVRRTELTGWAVTAERLLAELPGEFSRSGRDPAWPSAGL